MYGADSGTTEKGNRSVPEGSAGTSGGQCVRNAVSARRSAMAGSGVNSSAASCNAADGATSSNVGGYLSDSIDDGDDDEIRSEEVMCHVYVIDSTRSTYITA